MARTVVTRSTTTRNRRILKAHMIEWKKRCHAARVIANWWKTHCKDPITLVSIRTPFRLLRGNCFHMYDAFSLRFYILNSGDFFDPITRQPYYTHELMRLDRVTNSRDHSSIVHCVPQLKEQRKRYTSHIDLCDALEREICDQLSILIANIGTETDFESYFSLYFTSMLIQCYDNLLTTDKIRCHRCLMDMIHLCKRDIHDIDIRVQVIHFFHTLLRNC